jgi:hypothetical protein
MTPIEQDATRVGVPARRKNRTESNGAAAIIEHSRRRQRLAIARAQRNNKYHRSMMMEKNFQLY